MKKLMTLTVSIYCLALAACSNNSSSNKSSLDSNDAQKDMNPIVSEKESDDTYGPFNTGTSPVPISFYFDLDTGKQVELTEDEAASNSVWDLHFKRTDILLNSKAAIPVTAYFTGNNEDFFDAAGKPIKEMFIAATGESELADFTSVTVANVPALESFITDMDALAIGGGFYSYDPAVHIASAAVDKYFVVQSDGNFSKIRAKSLTTSGRVISNLTLGVAVQDITNGDVQFGAEMDVIIDTVACIQGVYVDLDTYSVVDSDGNWDITLPCVTVNSDTGADFEINLAEDGSAITDKAVDDGGYDGIAVEGLSHYQFKKNQTQIEFFKSFPWYEYAIDGGHGIWTQFGVYLIKTDTAIYKFQITGYYDDKGNSGQYSFRFKRL